MFHDKKPSDSRIFHCIMDGKWYVQALAFSSNLHRMLTFCSSIHACVLMKVLLRNFVSQQKCPQSLLASTTPQPSRLYKVGSAMACASSLSRFFFHIFQLNFSMHFSRTVVSDDAQLATGVWPSAGVRNVVVGSESAPDSRSRQPLHARGCALQSLQRSSPLVLQLARCIYGFKKLTVLKNAGIRVFMFPF